MPGCAWLCRAVPGWAGLDVVGRGAVLVLTAALVRAEVRAAALVRAKVRAAALVRADVRAAALVRLAGRAGRIQLCERGAPKRERVALPPAG